MHKKTLYEIDQNIGAIKLWTERYETKKEKIKLRPVKTSHVCLCEAVGMMTGMAIMGTNLLDLGALIVAGMGGAAVGALTPYIVKQIKIGDLNYQIFTNNLIMKDLEKEKAEAEGKVKKLYKK